MDDGEPHSSSSDLRPVNEEPVNLREFFEALSHHGCGAEGSQDVIDRLIQAAAALTDEDELVGDGSQNAIDRLIQAAALANEDDPPSQ